MSQNYNIGQSRYPFVHQRDVKKSGGLNTTLLAWERGQVIGESHTLPMGNSCSPWICCMRGNIKMNMAITQLMRNPGCFVLKITTLIGTAFKMKEPWNSPFEGLFRQV